MPGMGTNAEWVSADPRDHRLTEVSTGAEWNDARELQRGDRGYATPSDLVVSFGKVNLYGTPQHVLDALTSLVARVQEKVAETATEGTAS